jgi:1-deoxy-D-xylulose-5-phosphate reductoisomerase
LRGAGKKNVVVLGSTGSIGRNALDVIARHADVFEVLALSAFENAGLLAEQARRFDVRTVALGEEAADVEGFPGGVTVLVGEQALASLASLPEADIVLNALVGSAGLKPALAAVRAGKRLALANKESLVAAGGILTDLASRSGAEVIPVDSEHSSLSRCLRGLPAAEVSALVLTASGGPLRDLPRESVASADLSLVLSHPTWEMGPKVTIDSATLVNKAMEVIEAHWLFGFPFDRIEVVIHRESIVHAIVRLSDGTMLAHLGAPDMRVPIQYALFHPETPSSGFAECAPADLGTLHFERVERGRYPAFDLVLEAGRAGGTAPAIAATADEVAVRAFVEGGIPFGAIPGVIERALSSVPREEAPDLDAVVRAAAAARRAAGEAVSALGAAAL